MVNVPRIATVHHVRLVLLTALLPIFAAVPARAELQFQLLGQVVGEVELWEAGWTGSPHDSDAEDISILYDLNDAGPFDETAIAEVGNSELSTGYHSLFSAAQFVSIDVDGDSLTMTGSGQVEAVNDFAEHEWNIRGRAHTFLSLTFLHDAPMRLDLSWQGAFTGHDDLMLNVFVHRLHDVGGDTLFFHGGDGTHDEIFDLDSGIHRVAVRLDTQLIEAGATLAGTFDLAMTLTPAAGESIVGDMNLDGVVDTGDVAPFVLALTDPALYMAQFGVEEPTMISVGDVNGDGVFDTGDVAPFVELLVGGAGESSSVPEPGSLALLGLGALALVRPRGEGGRGTGVIIRL